MRVGYRRVSTAEQNLDRQDLGAVEKIFEEKVSASTTKRDALVEADRVLPLGVVGRFEHDGRRGG